jgi:hypothetical protein
MLHLLAALMTIYFAVTTIIQDQALIVGLYIAAAMMILLVFLHTKILLGFNLKTSLFFLFDSLALAAIAWKLYQQGNHRETFFYEGISIFFLSLAAFSYLLRHKKHVLYSEEQL